MSAPFSRAGRIRPFPEEPLRDDENPAVNTDLVLTLAVIETEPAGEILTTEDGYALTIT